MCTNLLWVVEEDGMHIKIQLKRPAITDRDIELFCLLNEQRAMVSNQIYGIFWPNTSHVAGAGRRRLTKLVESGYIKIFEVKPRWHTIKLFLLAKKGLNVLRKQGLDLGFPEIKNIYPTEVEHMLKLVNVRAVMRSLGAGKWRSERQIRKEDWQQGWMPDGDLQLHGLRISFELENSFRSKDRYVRRFESYARDKKYALVIFIVGWPSVRSWLLDLEMPQDKIGFIDYDDLIQNKGAAKILNKTSQIKLGSLF